MQWVRSALERKAYIGIPNLGTKALGWSDAVLMQTMREPGMLMFLYCPLFDPRLSDATVTSSSSAAMRAHHGQRRRSEAPFVRLLPQPHRICEQTGGIEPTHHPPRAQCHWRMVRHRR